ncbi:hypothetical protein XHV734_1079 [Xanthomonas hortorum pv. vitians]|nr:hypothetical protein XHV734_1079 [Xanthomonas hortorum pv. vitians]
MGGQGPIKMVGVHGFEQSNRLTLWCGVLADCGTVWRHGCRHRAYMDGLAACLASGEATAHSTNQAVDLNIRLHLSEANALPPSRQRSRRFISSSYLQDCASAGRSR